MNRDARWRELIDFILMMARRDDVWSVSCQFSDQRLWEGLLGEQIKRAQQTGLPLQEAYFLSGPDGGMHGIAKNHAGLEDRPEDQWYDGTTLEENPPWKKIWAARFISRTRASAVRICSSIPTGA